MTAARHAIGWGDLRGRRVGVWGLGVEGRASVARLRAMGVEPAVAEDDSGLGALDGCEVVVKSPGISRYRPEVEAFEAKGVPVVGGLGLWLQDAPRERVVCVTGTKGKSTTVSILGHLLERLGHRTVVGGNIGVAPWDPSAPDADRWVVEVSSYQATDVAASPPVVAVTSLHPDHLDWHGSVERYYADKLSLCSQPGAAVTVAADVPELRERRDLLGPEVVWVARGEPWSAALGLPGPHNARNAEVALRCLEALGEDVCDPAALAEGFTPLPGRLTTIARAGGVEFVDDGLSTNVLPTIAALDAFPDRRVALLTGGFDRGIDYAPLAAHVAARAVPVRVFTLPDNGPRIAEALAAAGVEATATSGVEEATRLAHEWARPDGVVLLSPAAPSYGRYRDHKDRGAAFAAAAAACGGG